MRVLVTGSGGFIGSNLKPYLIKRGFNVIGLDWNPDKKEDMVMDFGELNESLVDGIDTIVHLAAFGGVPESIKFPDSYFGNNVARFQKLLNVCHNKNIRFIYASSSSTKELLSPYAYTKKINEDLGEMYFKVYGTEAIGMRFHNVMGKKQREESVLPTWVRQFKENGKITINGSLDIKRDFTSVKDVCRFIELAITSKSPNQVCGQTYDIGKGEARSLSDLHRSLSTSLGENIPIDVVGYRLGDIKTSLADPLKAYVYFDFLAKVDLDEMVNDYLEGEGL